MNKKDEYELRHALLTLTVRYGDANVKHVLEGITRKGRGRPSEPDWPRLHAWFVELAVAYVKGQPGKSNYRIGEEFAEQFPGHTRRATADRIEAKMKKWRDLAVSRYLFALAVQEQVTAAEYIAALKRAESEALPPDDDLSTWAEEIAKAEAVLNSLAPWEYSEGMTFAEVYTLANGDDDGVPF